MPIPIPRTIDDVTSQWLADCLSAPVIAHEVEQIGQGVGIMGDIYRVALSYQTAQPDAPNSVVVKLPSSFEENRAQGVALGMFEAEVRFYEELAQAVSVGLPVIHHAQINSGTAEFVIVMEDLSHLIMVDQLEGMSVAQARAAVKVLAHVHAVWWNKAQSTELEWIPSMIGPRIQFVDGMLVDLLEPYTANFAGYLPPGGLEVYQGFAGSYLAINQTIAGRSPWTLVHQDFRVENIMFDAADTDRVVVLDWQGIGRGPGAYDVGYLLGGSMETELRRQHERELVRAYFDELKTLGVSDFSFEQLWEDYALSHFMGGLATTMVIGGGMDLNNARGVQLCATMSRRHVTAALDHGGVDRIEAAKRRS